MTTPRSIYHVPTAALAILAFAFVVCASRIAAADNVDTLITQLQTGSDYKVRLAAALGLTTQQDSRGIPALIAALADEDKNVRAAAAVANELTLVGMSDMYTKIGRPGVADKERVWLAVDHTVDPRNYADPKPTALIKLADDFAEETGITDYWRPNTTIMHTEFARQRAQPGQIVIGADSHTCSGGGMGALAIGLGAGDVVLPLVAIATPSTPLSRR